MTDKELLAFDFDDIADDLARYTWEWIDMGDDRVCPDCERLSAMPPATMEVWVTERTEPGRGDTVCGDRCRCILVPADLIEIFPDLRTEGKIVIDDGLLSGQVVNAGVPYEVFEKLDDLIMEYKSRMGGKKLPPEYYAINDVRRRISYLEGILR